MSLEARVLATLRQRRWRIATAESCTGGLVAERLTRIPGAGESLLGGIVAYNDSMKTALLGVPFGLLERVGGVSREAAVAMAEGARERTGAELAVSTTGFAGPTVPAKGELGLVFLGFAHADGTEVHEMRYGGPRAAVKEAAATDALRLALEIASRKA